MPIQLTPGKPQQPTESPLAADLIDQPPLKRCKTCGEQKPLLDFAGCGVTADKLQPNCRPCHSAKMTAGRAKSTRVTAVEASASATEATEVGGQPLPAVPPSFVDESRLHLCCWCRRKKQSEEFQPSPASKGGLHCYCNPCREALDAAEQSETATSKLTPETPGPYHVHMETEPGQSVTLTVRGRIDDSLIEFLEIWIASRLRLLSTKREE
ncbi:hypothetical protein [Paludisphaera rhizosphaerae]|uniref:hypothetical protein n=1 Tax=Paludisphaera rhizosphaerae TaxID=2711216 RepID=UPI0013ECB13F|nr:hypothetical protein [Paludisphaera rhizosphaerae]